MYRFMILCDRRERFSKLVQGLDSRDKLSQIQWISSIGEAIETIRTDVPDLMIIDEKVDGVSNMEAARQMVMANAMVNLAVVSGLSESTFHEEFEGLGILTCLPNPPDEMAAENLLRILESFGAANS